MTTQNAVYSKNMKMMNNQKRGRSFETRWGEYLYSFGYWVHFMNPAPDGSQPFDFIAVQGNNSNMPKILAMDCKTLSGNRFPIGRAEENQLLSFRALNRTGINSTFFVVECKQGYVKWIPSKDVDIAMQKGEKSILIDDYETVYFGIE